MEIFNKFIWTGIVTLIICIAGGGLVTSVAAADKRYVIDTLYVSLRAGAGKQYNTVKLLKSDTPVEVTAEENDFCKAVTTDGAEGWIPCRYLSKATPKPIVIEGLQKENERLKADLESVKTADPQSSSDCMDAENAISAEQADVLETMIAEKDRTILELERKLSEIKNEPRRPDGSEKLDRALEENSALMAVNESLKDRIAVLKKSVNRSESGFFDSLFSDGKGWFLIGAGVFILGLVFGSFMKNSKNRKFY